MQPPRWLKRSIPATLAAAVIAAFLVSGLGSPPPAAADPPAATPPPSGLSAAVAAPAAFRGYGAIGDMGQTAELGFNWIKLDVRWSDVQPSNGSQFVTPSGVEQLINQARSLGLNVLLNVHAAPAWATGGNTNTGAPPTDPATIQAFMQRLATYFNGRVAAYEYGNEPNTHDFWGKKNPDPAEFARVMSGFFKGTKAGDPNAFVVTGGLSNTGDGNGGGCLGPCSTVKGDLQFVMELFQSPARAHTFSCTGSNGSPRPCFDAIGHHPYGGPNAPETDPYSPNDPPPTGLYFQRLYQIYQMITVFGPEAVGLVAIWATEFGWLTDRGKSCDLGSARNAQKVNAQQQADYLVRAFQMMQSSRTISQLRASASTMPYPDVMGPLFVFNIDIRGADWSCTPPGSFDDRYYGISPEAKAALKAMPKQGITPIVTATPSPTPTRTGTPTHTPTVTPTYTRTPLGTPARKAFLPLISRLRAIGW